MTETKHSAVIGATNIRRDVRALMAGIMAICDAIELAGEDDNNLEYMARLARMAAELVDADRQALAVEQAHG